MATSSMRLNSSRSAFAGAAVRPRASARAGARARAGLTVVAKERPLWLTGSVAPKHLDGTLDGDYGFDPLGLGVCPDRLKWYVEAERVNGQWAMIAVAGILFTDLVGIKPVWYEAGAAEYWLPPVPQLAVLLPLMGFLENKRLENWLKTGTSGVADIVPFDPLGMGKGKNDMRLKEIKNGRLAMVAFAGFAASALITRKGPIGALSLHLADPAHNNIFGMIADLPQTLAASQ